MLRPRLTALDEKEILRYLGYGGQPLDAGFMTQLRRCMEAVTNAARPRAVYRLFSLTGTTLVEADLKLKGADIAGHLAGCRAAAVMAATIGAEADSLVMRTQVQNMADAVIMDACASAAIENVCDNLEADLRRECAARGEHLTGRFSPGYGDMPIEQQADILAALNAARAAGITLTGGNLMVPCKSVTAVMGVSPVPREEKPRGCASCARFETCAYRKEGKSCEGK